MFVDASALTAILAKEADAQDLLAKLEDATLRVTSPLAIWETSVALARLLRISPLEAHAVVEKFLDIIAMQEISVTPEDTVLAVEAFERYGKGRHPAALNFGDCFAYACARQRNLKLLYKGGDFARTDIATA